MEGSSFHVVPSTFDTALAYPIDGDTQLDFAAPDFQVTSGIVDGF